MTITLHIGWLDLLWITPLVLYALWWNYIATMSVRERWDVLPLASKALAFVPVLASWMLDVLCNVVIASALGLEWPREITLTKRLKRWKAMATISPRRARVARWTCANIINAFDEGHC